MHSDGIYSHLKTLDSCWISGNLLLANVLRKFVRVSICSRAIIESDHNQAGSTYCYRAAKTLWVIFARRKHTVESCCKYSNCRNLKENWSHLQSIPIVKRRRNTSNYPFHVFHIYLQIETRRCMKYLCWWYVTISLSYYLNVIWILSHYILWLVHYVAVMLIIPISTVKIYYNNFSQISKLLSSMLFKSQTKKRIKHSQPVRW